MTVTPDSEHRILLTEKIREALNLKPGQPLEVSITSGAVFLRPIPLSRGSILQKGNVKVFTGKIPEIDVEEAVSQARHYTR